MTENKLSGLAAYAFLYAMYFILSTGRLVELRLPSTSKRFIWKSISMTASLYHDATPRVKNTRQIYREKTQPMLEKTSAPKLPRLFNITKLDW